MVELHAGFNSGFDVVAQKGRVTDEGTKEVIIGAEKGSEEVEASVKGRAADATGEEARQTVDDLDEVRANNANPSQDLKLRLERSEPYPGDGGMTGEDL